MEEYPTGDRFFKQFLKDDLMAILHYFGQPYSPRDKKVELVSKVASYICQNPVDWLFKLPERDLIALRDIVDAGPQAQSYLEVPEYSTVLELLHIILTEDAGQGQLLAEVDLSIYNAVAPFIHQVIKDKERMGLFYAERLAMGIINIFGAISVKNFVSVLFDTFFDENNAEKSQALVNAICESSIVSLMQLNYEEEVYLLSPFVEFPEVLLQKLKDHSDISYAPITPEEALEAGLNTPFCACKSPGDEKQALLDMLKELEYNEFECLDHLNNIWICSQNPSDEVLAESLFESINDCIDDIPSFEQYCKYADIIAAYANSIPKWELMGHSADELGVLKIVNEQGEDESIAFPDGDSVGVATASLPRQDSLNDFFKYGITLKRPSPNEPCPCGSGLKYKNCHGKLLN